MIQQKTPPLKRGSFLLERVEGVEPAGEYPTWQTGPD